MILFKVCLLQQFLIALCVLSRIGTRLWRVRWQRVAHPHWQRRQWHALTHMHWRTNIGVQDQYSSTSGWCTAPHLGGVHGVALALNPPNRSVHGWRIMLTASLCQRQVHSYFAYASFEIARFSILCETMYRMHFPKGIQKLGVCKKLNTLSLA